MLKMQSRPSENEHLEIILNHSICITVEHLFHNCLFLSLWFNFEIETLDSVSSLRKKKQQSVSIVNAILHLDSAIKNLIIIVKH